MNKPKKNEIDISQVENIITVVLLIFYITLFLLLHFIRLLYRQQRQQAETRNQIMDDFDVAAEEMRKALAKSVNIT